MEKTARKYRSAVVSLGVCLLCVGLLVFGTACPVPPPPPACTSDADCAEGQVCNVTTGLCEAAPEPTDCTGCTEDQFCDVTTGECIDNVNLYARTRFDTDKDAVHFAPSGHMVCTVCHHPADTAAGVPEI